MFQRNVAKQRLGFASLILLSAFLNIAQPAYAQSWGQLKDAAAEAQGKKDFATAESLWKKSLELAGATGPRNELSQAGLAKLYMENGKAADAETIYEKLGASFSAGSLTDDQRNILADYSQLLKQKGSTEKIAELEKKFGGLDKKVESTAAGATGSASLAADSAPQEGSKQAFQRDYAIWTSKYKNACDLLAQKNYAQADKILRECLPFTEKYSNAAAMTSNTLARLEEICLAQGKNADGEAFSLQKVGAVRQANGLYSREFARSLMDHANWLRKLNRRPEAMAEERKAEAIMAKISPQNAVGESSQSQATIDASGTRGGSIYSRARAAQGLGGAINNMINSQEQ